MKFLTTILFISFSLSVVSFSDSMKQHFKRTFSDNELNKAIHIFEKYEKSLDKTALKAIDLIFYNKKKFSEKDRNYALYLLIHILQNNNVPENDSMPIALALAYNYNFSQSDSEVRKLLLADIVNHYIWYRELDALLDKINPGLKPSALPVIAQTYWASRDRSCYETRNKEIYYERLVPVEEYKRLFGILRANNLLEGKTIFDVAEKINIWYRQQKLPHDKLPSHLKGYAAGKLLDYQKKNGLFPSNSCVVDATHLSAIYQASGMGVATYYQNFRTAGAAKGVNHEWPVFYDPSLKLWVTAQIKNPWPSFTDEDVPVDFEIFRPMWHHFFIEEGKVDFKSYKESEKAKHAHIGGSFRCNSYGERTTNGLMRKFVFKGMNDKMMDIIWHYPVWKKTPDKYLTKFN